MSEVLTPDPQEQTSPGTDEQPSDDTTTTDKPAAKAETTPSRPRKQVSPAIKMLAALASLKLTVVLFALSIFLIFAGTLAQVEMGIWHVMAKYFRSLFVWIPLQIFFPSSMVQVAGSIPFPGGMTIGGLLIWNLVAAHIIRFKFTSKRIGIITLHGGVILLLVGELVTALYAKEGNMTIDEGSYSNFTVDNQRVELAFVKDADEDHDDVVVVPQNILSTRNDIVRDERLPLAVRVDQWMANSTIFGPAQAAQMKLESKADSGQAKSLVPKEEPRVSGVGEQSVDAPSAYVTLYEGEKKLGTYLFSVYMTGPERIRVGDVEYRVELRFARTYRPYTLHLIDFKHDKFVGTETPRNFSSLIRLDDPQNKVDREVLIYMNNPLRYAGETFYQSAFKPGDTGTILQVVRNPGWLIPYISCTLITIGMMLHFGINVTKFMSKRAKA